MFSWGAHLTETIFLLVSLLLVAGCGVFVAAEFALITVNRNSVERLADKGDKRAKGALTALRSLSTQLSGAQVGITLTNLAIGFLAEPSIATLLKGPLTSAGLPEVAVSKVAILVGITLATIVTMVFGELVPKNLAIAKPVATVKRIQGAQRLFSRLMRVPIKVLNGSANFLLRRMGVEPQEELASARSADELSSLVRRSAEKGTLAKETAIMLERSLAFGDLTAEDVMTPRVRMRTVHINDTASSVLSLARRTGLSRFPVVGKNLDDVVGLVHIRHALVIPKKQRHRAAVSKLMQAPIVVPSSLQLDPLLNTLRGGGLQMAVVIDEFGGTDGLVTMEDLLEEIVGEVHDEHDRITSAIRKREGGGWIVSGLLRPDEIGEELNVYLPEEEDLETVGGLVGDRLERIPKTNDSVDVEAVDRDGIRITARLRVIRMDGRRVDRILLEVLPFTGDAGTEERA